MIGNKGTLTVAELIEVLQEMPRDFKVYSWEGEKRIPISDVVTWAMRLVVASSSKAIRAISSIKICKSLIVVLLWVCHFEINLACRVCLNRQGIE